MEDCGSANLFTAYSAEKKLPIHRNRPELIWGCRAAQNGRAGLRYDRNAQRTRDKLSLTPWKELP
jgi:hypothetical protein